MKRAFLLLLALTAPAFGDTAVSGNIAANTTWTLAGSPYILSGDVTIGGSNSPVLTIEPGVVVKGNAGSQLLVNYYDKGALVANGTAEAPIIFTANGSTAAGFWYGLRFGASANAPASSMAYTTVEYAGSNAHSLGGITVLAFSPSFDHVTTRVNLHAGIRINNGTPSVTASESRENSGYGIYVSAGGATLTSVALTNNSGMAVSVAAATQLSGMTGIAATGNGTNAVEYRDGTINASRTWKTCAIPYVVAGSIYVNAGTAPILTIEPGNTIRFNASSQIVVNHYDKGGLVANGTPTAPILFTSSAASPAAGAWYGLYVGGAAGGTATSISYATIEYGGLAGSQRGGITTFTGSPALDHVTIRNNAYAGAAIHGGSPSFADATITANGGPGIRVVNENTTLSLTNVALTDNNGHAVSAAATTTFAETSGLTASGNGAGRDAIEVREGTIGANRTWPLSAIPYVVTGSLYVNGSAAPILTIAAGNTVRFNGSSQIAVNHYDRGGLAANGTETAPIVFTSNGAATAGAWWGLYFGGAANPPASSVQWATIEYGGLAGSSRGGLTVHAGAPLFDHVTVRNNVWSGVAVHGGSPVIRNSTITANGGPGINVVGATSLTLSDDVLTNNSGHAVTLPCTTTLAEASGLTASGNGTGRDAIEIRDGTISANRTWPLASIPYVVTGHIYVNGGSAPVLTIAAGNTVRFNASSQIAVNHFDKGGLQANGTEAAPIVFTTNGAATAGHWWGLYFGGAANPPASSVSWATIEYGGLPGYGRGGLTVHIGAPVFDHVTVRNNTFAGLAVHGGSPVLRNSTVSANSGPGLNVVGAAAVTVTDVAFTNNSDWAITLPATVPILSPTGLSATGNGSGRNAIEYRAGTVSANMTWPTTALPYVVSGTLFVNAGSGPVLTIAPGNTVKFASGAQIAVNYYDKGALRADGTAAAPIVFTSNGTATAGYWLGLWFGASAGGPQSSVSYSTVEYGGSAGSSRGGITVNALAPLFDHLTLRNNAYAGLVAAGPSSTRIVNSSFSSNPDGVRSNSPAVVAASLNYWNSAAGPCLPGSCASGQQSATAGVAYEPWLLSAPVEPHFLSTATQKNRAFSPAIGAQTILDYTTSLAGDVAATIRNGSGTAVRTLNATGTPGSLSWDGKNDSGTLQPDGAYTYEIAAVAASQPPAAIAKGVAIIDSTRAFALGNPAVNVAFFSPNADNVQDTTTVTATTNYDDAAWTVSVLDASSSVVRTQSGSGTSISYAWDGKNTAGAVQPDGVYTFRVDATEGTASAQKSASATLDITSPVAAITTPAATTVLSNVYANGSTSVSPTGSATDLNLLNWTLQWGTGPTPNSWGTINSGTISVTSASLGTWQTTNHNNGTYSLRLVATDKAGNTALATASPLTIGNFKATQSAYQFNVGTGGTITYTSTVPFALTETLTIRNEAGAVVRTVVSAARAAGAYNDVFNGRNDADALLPDGPYFYIATLTDGTHTMTWDLSNDFRNDYGSYNDGLGIQAYDPFNNKPMKFNYNFSQPGRVTIATTKNSGSVVGNCLAPNATFYCPVIDRWEESGPHSFTWSGIDHTGAYRTIRSAAIVIGTTKFPKNAAVLFGTKPKVENVKVTPPIFGPAVGTPQTIELDLTTYQSQPANVSIALVNLSTLSTLRTLTLANQAAGHVTTNWDGRADNGMLIAPGYYAVIVTATDAIGNIVKGDILTTIQY